MPLVPALRRQRQVDLWKFKASLVYIGICIKDVYLYTVSKNKPDPEAVQHKIYSQIVLDYSSWNDPAHSNKQMGREFFF